MGINNVKRLKAVKHFSAVSPRFFKERTSPSEALLEEWLRRTPDDQLKEIIFFFHDWAVANEGCGFHHLAKCFDQDRAQLDQAIDLFKKHRKNLCLPDPADENYKSYSQLQLYLLHDCLIHAASIKQKGGRQISYLKDLPQLPNDIISLSKMEMGVVYNYVVINGTFRLGSKHCHHSELALGKPVTAAGEALLTREPDGTYVLVVNHLSGHYRPLTSSMNAVQNLLQEKNFKVRICSELLSSAPAEGKASSPHSKNTSKNKLG